MNDLSMAWRAVAGHRALSAVIVVSLALGTGANAAVYSAIDALLFRPPAGVTDPGTLVDIYTSQINGATYGLSSFADYVSLSRADGLEAAAAIDDRQDRAVQFGDRSRAPRVVAVSPEFWNVLRMPPPAGRWDADGTVVSFDLWQQFGADPSIAGKPIVVDGRTYRVAAVAPPGFRGLHVDRVFDVWVPLGADAGAGGRGDRHMRIVGRVAAGADLDRVQTSLGAIAAALARDYPATNMGTLRTAEEPRRLTALAYSRLDPALRWRTELLAAALVGATALMLLSACVNTGSLLLSRGMARRTELTIKIALGADRGRLVRQLLVESVLLAGAGAALGALAAAWSAGAIPALFAPDHARLLDTHVDPRVIAITLGAGILTGIVCGLAPALVSTRALVPGALRGDAARIGERQGAARLRLVLVGAQLALSTVFLIASALLTTIVDTALGSQRSRASGELTVATIEVPPGSDAAAYRAAATEELGTLPSIDGVGWVSSPPAARTARRTFRIARGEASEPVDIDINFATRDYFRTIYLPVIEGRPFVQNDAAERDDVAIVNDALAQRYFPGHAVGRTLTEASGKTIEIVGVVQNRSYRAFDGPAAPMVYYPMASTGARAYAAVVRSKAYAPADDAVRAALLRAGTPVKLDVLSFDAYLARALAPDRLIARLAGVCGLAALALALVGVYGVLGDLVRRRTREIGLRIALGATPWQVLKDVVGAGLWPALAGIVIGVLGAETAIRVARAFVYELPVLDAGLVAATAAALVAIVIGAVVPPALRAIRISPAIVLRT